MMQWRQKISNSLYLTSALSGLLENSLYALSVQVYQHPLPYMGESCCRYLRPEHFFQGCTEHFKKKSNHTEMVLVRGIRGLGASPSHAWTKWKLASCMSVSCGWFQALKGPFWLGHPETISLMSLTWAVSNKHDDVADFAWIWGKHFAFYFLGL